MLQMQTMTIGDETPDKELDEQMRKLCDCFGKMWERICVLVFMVLAITFNALIFTEIYYIYITITILVNTNFLHE